MSIQTKLTPVHRVTALVGGTFAMTLALAACGGGSDTPEGAVENFLDNGVEDVVNAMANGDFEGAAEASADYLCAEDVTGIEELGAMTEGMSPEEIAEGMGDDIAIPEDWSYEIGETTEDGDTASVEVTMTENGETTDETFDLVKEEDEWKICGAFV